MFMEMGSGGPKAIEAVVDYKLFIFEFTKFGASNDVALLSCFHMQVGGGDVSGAYFRSVHFGKKETQSYCFHANDTSISFFRVHWGTTTVCHQAGLSMTIELAGKHNEVWDARVIPPQFLPWFETSEGLVFIDPL